MYLNNGDFDFVESLESAYADVRAECLAIPNDSFDPWVQKGMYDEGWDVFGLIAWGYPLQQALESCPRTHAIIKQVPGVQTAGFSRLRQGATIVPHRGWDTNVYRLHPGLVVPDNCGMTVAGETKSWEEGKCLIFDDTSLHEAWNNSNSDRYILLLDFLRPGHLPLGDDAMPIEVREMLAQKINGRS